MSTVLIAVDTETTGLHVGSVKAHPIEIAAVLLDDFDVAFEERIKPSIDISAGATAVHGISIADLASCRTELEVMTDFVEFVSRASAPTLAAGGTLQLVAHNAAYDRDTLEAALARCGLTDSMPPHSWLCTMLISRSLFSARGYGMHTLAKCCERAKVAYIDAHAALADAKMCAQVYKALLANNQLKAPERDIEDSMIVVK